MEKVRFEETLDKLGDGHLPLRPSLLFKLSHLSLEHSARLRSRWSHLEVARRRKLLEWLVQIAEEDFRVDFNAIFRLGLEDADEVVRALAIEGLWEVEEAWLLEKALDLVKGDASELVRAKAATALGRFALLSELGKLKEGYSSRIREGLLEVIRNSQGVSEVRRRAVEAVSYFGGEEIRGVIANAYVDDDDQMCQSAIFAMGRNLDPSWADALLAELNSASPAMRYEAARACGELELAEAVEALGLLAESDSDGEVKGAAIWALGQIGGDRAREIIEATCETDDEGLAEAAREALFALETSRGLPEVSLKDWFLGEEDEEEPD